jgi:hypothetical protein
MSGTGGRLGNRRTAAQFLCQLVCNFTTSHDVMMIDPVFYDFEASAMFDGFPIEVGWAYVLRDTVSIASEGHLIEPVPEWDHLQWDEEAELLHGISLATLAERRRTARRSGSQNECRLECSNTVFR